MYQTILVPLDGSKRAESILSHVEKLAQFYSAKVVFMTVVRPPKLIGYASQVTQFQQELEQMIANAESYLNGLRGEFHEKGINAKTIVVHGPVLKEILFAARRENVDLIAIASNGRGGLSRLFNGSVAAGVINRADRSLLLARSRRNN
jgi:nucleotide-binding universal stress UspA family protein